MPASRILVVDDEEDIRELIARYLHGEGYDVLLAINGQQGVDRATAEQPDLVLMDLGMRIMDGWEAHRRLRADARTERIPIVALTAADFPGDRERVLDFGFDAYESKPVDFDSLTHTVRTLLARP